MRICGHCGYERKEIDNILDAGSCPRCGIVCGKGQAKAGQGAKTHPSPLRAGRRVYEMESINEMAGHGRPLVKCLAALSLIFFAAIVVLSVVVLYQGQNTYSVISREAIVLAIAGIFFAILALTGVGKYGSRGIVAPAILGILFNVGWIAVASPALTKITSDEYKLERAVQHMNKYCPIMAKDARIDAVYYEPSNKITFSMTLVKIAWKDLPGYGREDVKEQAKSYMVNYIRKNEKLYRFYHKIECTCVVKTNDGVEYVRITIRPSDFG